MSLSQSLPESQSIYRTAAQKQVLACQTHRRFDFMGELGYPLYAQSGDGAQFTASMVIHIQTI
jgi:hypothetical protein